jgi:hypothetical protein
LKKTLKKAMALILDEEVAVVFTTSINSDDDSLRRFKDRVLSVFLDEGSSIVDAQIAIPWKGDLTCFIAGDPAQLGPCCISSKHKYDNGRLVNSMANQYQYYFLGRLSHNNWPCWLLLE